MDKKFVENIFFKIKSMWQIYETTSINKSVELLEYELGELENIFGLLVLSNFVGLPSPPMNITLDLIPEMEKHLTLLLNKIDTAENPLSDLASILNIT